MAFWNIFFPLMYAVNWYHFFDPMRNGFMPYVAFQAGYPVLGFIPYGLLALSCPSPLVYGYVMRYVNLALLSISFLVLYKVVEIHRGRRDALFTLLAVTLSLSIIAANPYSNDVIALFFSSLALFFLMKKSSALCGFSIGLAVLAKLYPVILLPLSLAFFEEWKKALDAVKNNEVDVITISWWNEYAERTNIEPHYDFTALDKNPFFLYNKTKTYSNCKTNMMLEPSINDSC